MSIFAPATRQFRSDAEASSFLEGALRAYDPQIYRVVYVEPEFQKHLPMNNRIPPGAAEYSYVVYDGAGMAAWYTGNGSDLPRVTATKTRVTHPMRDFGIASDYSDQDLERAAWEAKFLAAQGVQDPSTLEVEKENISAVAIAQFHENVAVLGDSSSNILGITTQPNIGEYVIPNGEAGSPLWDTKTPDEILADMNNAVAFVVNSVRNTGALIPDTMVLPLASFQKVSTTPRSIHSDMTILEHFLKNNRYIKQVEAWPRFDDAGPDGSRFGLVYRKDPMVLEYRTGRQFERVAPQRKALGWEVYSRANSGGVVVKYPVAVAKFTGF